MPKRISTPRLDAVQNARRVVLASVGEADAPVNRAMISLVMAEMGRKGGRIGGKRRLVTLTGKRRSQIAAAAAKARWAKPRKKAKG